MTAFKTRNIIQIDLRQSDAGGRHQIGTPAGFGSEQAAGFILECMAGFVGIRTERPTPSQSDMSRYVAQVESENAMLKEHVAFLREQSQVKDTQIAALLERDRETNYLVRGLQHMLAPLLGRGGEPTPPTPLAHHEAADERMSDEGKDIGISA